MDNQIKILQIGRYPPPYGGITVHIQRLADLCISNGLDCQVIDLYRSGIPEQPLPPFVYYSSAKGVAAMWDLWRFVTRRPVDIMHVHVSAMGRAIWGLKVLLNAVNCDKNILTIHHGDFVKAYLKKSFIEKFIIRKTLANFDVIIVPTVELEDALRHELGTFVKRVAVIPTFLPPDTASLPASLPTFDDFRCSVAGQGVDGILLISGFGFDYYGFDLLIQAVERLALKEMRFGVVVSFYGPGDKSYKTQVVQNMQKYAPTLVMENLLSEQFLYVLKHVDAYVRPTLIDSCGVTVYESLMFGVPTVASDVCTRPEGVFLHKSGDVAALAHQIEYVFNRSHILNVDVDIGASQMINLYTEELDANR